MPFIFRSHVFVQSCAAALLLAPVLLCAQIRQQAPSVEFTPVGRLESRNYQHLSYGLAAFSRQAALGYSLETIKQHTATILCVPNLDGIDLNAPLTLHYLRLRNGPAPDDSQAKSHCVSIVTLADKGELLFDGLRTIYADFKQHPWGVTFTTPNSGYNWPHPQVTVSLKDGRAFLSPTPAAVEWMAGSGRVLQLGKGDDGILAGSFLPNTLVDLLLTARPQSAAAETTPVLTLFARLVTASLPRLDAIDLTAQADGTALSLAALLLPQQRALPAGNTAASDAAALDLACAAAVPADAVYASIEVRPSPFGDWLSNALSDKTGGLPTLKQLASAPAAAHVAFLVPSSKSQSLIYVSILETDAPAAQLPGIVKALVTSRLGSRLAYRPQADRTSGACVVQSFRMEYDATERAETLSSAPSATISSETLPLLLALAAGGLNCELTATSRHVVLALGPSGVIDEILPALAAAKPNAALLRSRWQPAGLHIPENAESVTVLYPVRLFRQLVQILPGSRVDLVRRIPTLGDGMIAYRTPTREDGRAESVLRIAANELNSLQLAFAHGQPVIRELLINRAFQSLLRKPAEKREDGANETDAGGVER